MRDWRKWHPAPGIGPGEEGSIPLFLNFIRCVSEAVIMSACHAEDHGFKSRTHRQDRGIEFSDSMEGARAGLPARERLAVGIETLNLYNW